MVDKLLREFNDAVLKNFKGGEYSRGSLEYAISKVATNDNTIGRYKNYINTYLGYCGDSLTRNDIVKFLNTCSDGFLNLTEIPKDIGKGLLNNIEDKEVEDLGTDNITIMNNLYKKYLGDF